MCRLFGVSTGGRWSGNSCYFADVSKIGQNPLLLSAFLLCSRCVALEICLYSRFKGIFSAVWGCCAGLCCLGALRGLSGFCVRVGLGGFRACCVFCLSFSSFLLLSSLFLLSSCSCPASLLGFLPCLLSCSLSFLCVLLFLFPFRIKRKRAHLFCALSLLGFGVFILSYLRR